MDCTNNDLVDISIEFVEQSNQKISTKSLSGDIKNVGCGSKKIVWNINNDNIEYKINICMTRTQMHL